MKKEVKILEYRMAPTEEKAEKGYLAMGKFWFVDKVATTKNIKELLEEYLSDGWKIEFASEIHYVLSRKK
jgi:hypothetical protein